jgi:hypothetical protein
VLPAFYFSNGMLFNIHLVKKAMSISIHKNDSGLLQRELDRLDEEPVLLGGQLVKPSDCYRFSSNPPHVLYNTNCPEALMEKIEYILSKYNIPDEGRA